MAADIPRTLRAPRGQRDVLSDEQVQRYLGLIDPRDYKVLSSTDFQAHARRTFSEAGGGALQGSQLCAAVETSLSAGCSANLRAAIKGELSTAIALSQVYDAFRKCKPSTNGAGVICEEIAAFVQFCVAYRIHCYFETQQLDSTVPVGSTSRPEVVFVLGGPGAGKGTQCARISQTYGYQHLSVGDLLRAERRRPGSELGQLIEGYIKEGKLVPVEITVKLIQQAMKELGGQKYLIDGFPRSFSNLEGWERFIGDEVIIKFAVFFDCSEACMEARLLERGKTSGRADDNPESIRKRFKTFKEESLPVLESLGRKGLVRRIESERSVEEVWRSVQSLFGPSVVFVLGGPGAGKGTQCSQISQNFGYVHLSVGDLLREERKRAGADAELIEKCMKDGQLVPNDIVVKLLREAMCKRGWEGGKYLIDGFPRSFENLKAWDASFKGQALVTRVLYFECSEGAMEARVLQRGKTSGRSDDNVESVRGAFRTFYHESLPVIEQFQKEGRVARINAERAIEAVWSDVQVCFGPSIVFVLGGPGAGKGTQCTRISEMFGYKHLSAGDLLREERKRPGSEYGELIENYIKEGKIVPVEITIKLLEKAMRELGWEGGKYLIDGFPRSMDNLMGFKRLLGGKVNVKFTIFFDVDEAVMEARLLERGKTSGRSDDNIASIKKRFVTFQQDSIPVVEKFRSEGTLRMIDAAADVETVWQNVRRLFGPTVIFVLGGPGAGKGTQCTRMEKLLDFHKLTCGDLIREESENPNSEHAAMLKACLQDGRLIPSEVLVQILQQAMDSRGWEGGNYIVDGFPRSMANLEQFMQAMGGKVFLKPAVCFDCSPEIMLMRRVQGSSDDQELIKKRIQSFQAEFEPVTDKLQADGLLRRIDAEHEVEEVWDCVQEVLHNEMYPHIMNQAMVLIKPHAQNKEALRFIQSLLTRHSVAVLRKGTVSAKDVMEKGYFDRQYFQIMQNATADPKALDMPASSQQIFSDAYGVKWADALSNGEVINCSSALSVLGKSNQELSDAGDSADKVKVAPSLYLSRLADGCGKFFYVVNSFALHWRDKFVASGEDLVWLVVEFNPTKVSWQRFRTEICGATNPAKAHKDSIRAQMYGHWQALGLREPPDTMNNCVHLSAGPIEGLRERMTWTGVNLTTDPLGRLLLSSGVPQKAIESWLENASVDGWRAGREVKSGLIFNCTEDCDTSALRDSAVCYAQEKLGGLQCWRMRTSDKALRQGTKTTSVLSTSSSRPKVITVLHFNDVYNVEPRNKEPVGGISRFVTKMRELKAESVARGEPEAVCLFSGDAFNPSLTSTVTKGRHMVPALNAIGIHTACYGNHDFDFGLDQLEKMAAETNFPWLISNCTDKATGKPLANGIVTRMIDIAGRKIGLIGLVEREWLVTLATLDPDDVIFEDFCPCAKRLAKQLKDKQGAEVVIALTHMRMPNDQLLAHEVEEIDIILGGHDHHYEVGPVGPHGTWVLNSGTDFRDITALQLEFSDEKSLRPIKVKDSKHIEITAEIAEDPEMKEFVDGCLAKVGSAMDKVIGETACDLDCRFASIRTKETNIGNFVADVMRAGLKADVAMINSGTLRADAIIEKGEIRMRDLVNLLPMLDELCLLQVTGQQLLALLQNSVSQYPRLEGRFAQVSGVTFTFDAAKPGGQRVLEESVRIDGKRLDMSANYKLVTKDYLRQGKDGYDVFREAICLADGEQAGILPTMVREHFQEISTLNGFTSDAPSDSTKRASALMSGLTKVGDGPEPTKIYAIDPIVEGRIICLNPVNS